MYEDYGSGFEFSIEDKLFPLLELKTRGPLCGKEGREREIIVGSWNRKSGLNRGGAGTNELGREPFKVSV